MSDFWIYLLIFVFGNLTGIILAIKLNLGAENVFKGRVKIKQRGRGNQQAPTLKGLIQPKTKREKRKLTRKDK